MKTSDIAVIKSEKSLSRVERPLALRGIFLRKLGVEQDERKIDLLIDEYLLKAEVAGKKATEDPRQKHPLVYGFLGNALALFLLAFEPKPRSMKLMNRLHSDYVISKHADTTLLGLILKALGPYRHGDRRTVHRDSLVLEYLISKNLLPSDIPAYLGTRGQGLHKTYHMAQNFFNAHNPNRRQKCSSQWNPKLQGSYRIKNLIKTSLRWSQKLPVGL
jgi:hypothetical protein